MPNEIQEIIQRWMVKDALGDISFTWQREDNENTKGSVQPNHKTYFPTCLVSPNGV